MWKYAALLSYTGTDYCGWQRQKEASGSAPSVQGTVEAALQQITREESSVVGSGRTDSGVHALGQVAHFVLKNREWEPRILLKGFNAVLPTSVRVIDIRPVPLDFHAQRSAERKQYSYYFQQGPSTIPHLEPLSWWIQKRLNLEAMNAALADLVGEHDFKPFQSSGARPGPTVRKILEAEAIFEPIGFPGGGLAGGYQIGFVRIRILGTGFLKQMVRGIAGTLLQVGENRRDPGCIREILESGDRFKVGPTAPARALWLERVWYPGQYGLEVLSEPRITSD